MKNNNETEKLFNENTNQDGDCNLCKEALLEAGRNTGYGIIIYKIETLKNGWFAALSPKTGGDPRTDFTIQLMPFRHLTHFSQISSSKALMKNYGIAFSEICRAMTMIMMQDENLKANSLESASSVSIATYGKSTTWKEKKEHLHIKIFPFRGNIGQPYTVDSSFGKKEVFKGNDGKEFVKMKPVRKIMIEKQRFDQLAKNLIEILKK